MIQEIDVRDIRNVCLNENQLKKDRLLYFEGLLKYKKPIEPIIVKKCTKGYWLLNGSHLVNVYRKNHIKTIKAVIEEKN